MARGKAAIESAKSTADFRDAAREFEQAAAIAPNWPEAYYNLGLVREKSGDYDEAIAGYKRYLQLVPASSADAGKVQETIYKLEYLRERNNITGIWKVDPNESNVSCEPSAYMHYRNGFGSSVFMIDDIQLDIQRSSDGLKARILSSKNRFGGWFPDGAFTPVQRDGELVKVFDANMYTCHESVREDHCPWLTKFILTQSAANVLEGTIDVGRGFAYKVVSYNPFRYEPYGINCDGKVVLKRMNN